MDLREKAQQFASVASRAFAPRWRRQRWLLGILLIVGFAYLNRITLLILPARILMQSDQVTSADAIVVLVGEYIGRPAKAAELYHNKVAPLVIMAKPAEPMEFWLGLVPSLQQLMGERLIQENVPREAFFPLTSDRRISGTLGEAELIRDQIKDRFPTAKKIVLVTSWSHTRRAKYIFNHAFQRSGVEVSVVPSFSGTSPSMWWQTEEGFLEVYTEYLKWTYYLLKLGYVSAN